MLSDGLKLKADLFPLHWVLYKAVRHTQCQPSHFTPPCTSVLEPHDYVLMICYISSACQVSLLTQKEGYVSGDHLALSSEILPHTVTRLFVSRTVNQQLEICQTAEKKAFNTAHSSH